jgi:threonine dehydratase
VRRTPVLRLDAGGRVGVPVWLKLKCLQLTGSFKVRNASAFLLGTPVPDAGVVAVSGGNFGLAMAYAARALGHPITLRARARSEGQDRRHPLTRSRGGGRIRTDGPHLPRER